MTRSRRSMLLLLIAGLLPAVVLTGCKSNSIAAAANSSSNDSSTTGLERIPPGQRSAALTVTGTTLQGAALSTASYRGKVVVLNYWGSWCGPCIKETPALKAAWKQLAGQDVQFVGLDSQEEATTGLAFMQANGLDYPSLAWNGGTFLLQLKGKAPAPPATLVLDQQGRLAGRVLSEVDTTTLVGMVDDVLAGQ